MGKPKQIYSDPDASMLGNELKGFLEREGVETGPPESDSVYNRNIIENPPSLELSVRAQ
jgi:hypothetical protein